MLPNVALLLPVALVLFLLSFALFYIWALMPRSGTIEWIHLRERSSFGFVGGRYPLGWLDALAIVLIAGLWLFLALFNLGDREAPQSFHGFQDEYVVIDMGEPTDLGRVRYFTGLGDGEYALYFSQDGVEWHRQGDMTQGFAEQFKWLEATVIDGTGVRYVRLWAESEETLYLGELALYNAVGQRLEPGRFFLRWSISTRATGGLFDEQHLVPDRASFLNSMYFDEIYHGQAAYQIADGLWPSTELSHPPLGKILIALGIQIFGMTPFGWRFMGAFMGAVILALFYCMVKGMFGRRLVAVCTTLIFASSFMHFAQTRIATIDTYVVLFVLLQFWFLYRYISQDYERPFWRTLPSLALAGLFFGLGAASKWSSLYLAPALAILWLLYQIQRGKHYTQNTPGNPYRQDKAREFRTYLIKTIVASCVFFLLIPGIVYYLSYIPYSRAMGYGLFSAGHWNIVMDNQDHMWWFHNAVAGVEHGGSSHWWQWMLNIQGIIYYFNTMPDGSWSVIATFGNPAVYWGGLLAMIAMPVAAFRRGDGRAFAILLCYVMLLLPWVFIPRTSFAYHYFPNIIFLGLAIAYVFDHLIRRRRGKYKTAIVAFTVMAAGLFVLFYPVLSGMPLSHWYRENILSWFEAWPF